jgi:hypothetical protein
MPAARFARVGSSIPSRLSHTEEQIGGAPLVRDALRHVHHVAPAVGGKDERLQVAASELARQAALVLHDTRHLDQAEKIASLALALAARAGAVRAQAQAYETLSLIRTYGVPKSRAAEYVRRGLALDGLDDGTRAMLLVRLGRSLAVLPGQERPVRRALDEAQGLATRLSPVDGAEVLANSGIALSDCGLHKQGAVDLNAAVESVEARSPLLLGLYRARLTKSAIKAKDVTAAAEGMNALAGVVPLVTSRRLDIHLGHIMSGTRQWGAVREIGEAREQLREITR